MTQREIIPVVIPARNESTRIIPTIESIRRTGEYAGVHLEIVVVDDGSKDDTAKIAREYGCHVIEREDRGYSALGKPELADTHNSGFDFIFKNFSGYKYLMVFGADTTCEENYISLLIKEMESDENLAMCAGVIDGYMTNKRAVRGSGRIIRKSFWDEIGNRLDNRYYSWESYPIAFANANGYETRTVYEAIMQTSRPPLKGVDWYRYGIGAKENGTIFPYVLMRAIKACFKISPKQGFRLILGYLPKAENPYPEKLRNWTKSYQRNRIKNLILKPFKK